ncbi:MAG: TetR/AcrR family transcriptional regulator [Marinosulfonomonas sp.]|nr:TetR/AcrR family transcriptional regulator [Marinosulfonomonas sp.]
MARKTGSHSETTGPLVRQAALRLFAQGGYAAVSMRQIASEVGLQAGALYLYTPDKQTLLFDMMHEHLEELLTAWDAVEKPTTPVEQLQTFTQFHIRFHLERLDAVFIANMELRNLSPENFAVIEKLRKAYEDELQSILAAGHAGGAFRVPDLKLATLAIIAMLTGVNTWYREGGRLSRDRVERIYWNMVRRSVGA